MQETKTSKKVPILTFCIICLIGGCTLLYSWAYTKVERYSFNYPDGKYLAVVSSYKHLDYTFFALPGSGSDYPCFLAIYEADTHRHMGTAPVSYSWAARDVVWETGGAYINMRPDPEWNFKKFTCTYYDDNDKLVSGL